MRLTITLATLFWTSSITHAAEDRPLLVLDGQAAKLVVDLGGGSIADFHLKSNQLNPLQWDSWSFSDTPDTEPPPEPRSMGHFLCLDRWGPATEAELAHGMGWHGEATRVWWTLDQEASKKDGQLAAQMSAELPLAGLKVTRSIRMAENQAVFTVSEAVTNTRHLGRIYNIVQHPTIGPPFLDESTVVDANGTRGFMQETPMPTPEDPEVRWPHARQKDGTQVDIRHLTNDAAPGVVSSLVEEEYGWTTAINAAKGLLIGYIWPTADYPWFDAWRHVKDDKPFARGLEFGTTGLHQPGPVLVEKGKIFDRKIFRFIDSDETQVFSYANFLMEIPVDFAGVAGVDYAGGQLVVREDGGQGREVKMAVGDLFP
ncbi:MAG: hypothetical protein VX293_08540 [Candidatus Latescibacterota bacterium]|nr:hypothetical protein [Candidatus Latescibacterota bacterium]